MPPPTRVAHSTANSKRSPRFATIEQFLAEYDKGSSLPIDLDPRIDFTRPVYEQVIALRRKNGATTEESAKGSRRNEAK